MKKKTYQTPEMQVVELRLQQPIQVVSDPPIPIYEDPSEPIEDPTKVW